MIVSTAYAPVRPRPSLSPLPRDTHAGVFHEIETTDLDWEKACGGSNIRVTKVDGKTALIEAFAEHPAESRAWNCHFVDGKIVSATHPGPTNPAR